MIVAVLHDVLEDGPEELINVLGKHFTAHVVGGIVVLTRQKDEDYFAYISRIVGSGWERVKLADLRHNMDLSRLPDPNDKDVARFYKYLKSYQILEAHTR